MKFWITFVAVYFLVFAVFHAWLLTMAAFELHRHNRRLRQRSLITAIRSPLAPPISIVVPAYNEELGIVDSIRSLLALDYPTFELVVVNDGSSDATMQRLVDAFALREVKRPTPPFLPHTAVRGVYLPSGAINMIVVDKENGGGKADALNAGINFSSFPLFCAIDADSVLEQDALVKTALPFIDEPVEVIASGGLVRIVNGCRIERGRILEAGLPKNKLAMFQVVEYLRAFFGARTGWSAVNGLLIISGAFGVFRKDAVIAVGGYSTKTVGEDMELVVRLRGSMRRARRPHRIVYVPDPVCWTEAPETRRGLRSQRRRWHRGSTEVLALHARMFGNPRDGAAGLLGFPALLAFELVGPLIELSGYVVVTIALLTGTVSATTFLLFLAISLLYGLLLSFGAIALEDATFSRHDGWDQLGRVMTFAVLENFGYRQLGHIWRLQGFWQLARKTQWEPMERRGLSVPDSTSVAGEVGLR